MLDRLTEDAAAWLDRGTEHPHRVALSVRGDCLGAAVEQLRAGFQAAGVQAGLARHCVCKLYCLHLKNACDSWR